MIRINLLPHRAEKRRTRQIQFVALCLLALTLGVLIVGAVHVAVGTQISNQDARNNYLKQEITMLDKQIAEIKKLRAETQALLVRKNVVEGLQSTRSDVVHLMDQMLRILPDGVYLQTLKQDGNQVTIVGFSQSNARISTLMRAVDDSPWLEGATLVEIHASPTAGGRQSQFTLKFNLSRENAGAAAPKAGKRG
ncbi:MAG: PilN domain-containing protein [Pseudomonadota bacterium]